MPEGATSEEFAQILQQAAACGATVLLIDQQHAFPTMANIDAAMMMEAAAWAAEAKLEEAEKAEYESIRQRFPQPENTKPRPAQCVPRLPRVVSYAASAEKPRPPPGTIHGPRGW